MVGKIEMPFENNTTLLRLILALEITLQHFLYLTKKILGENSFTLKYPDFSIYAFFILSGILVTRSYEQTRTLSKFYKKRICNIV